MSITVEQLKLSISRFDEEMEENDDFDDDEVYDFMFFLQEGDPETEKREAKLDVGLAEFVYFSDGDGTDFWLIFKIEDNLFKIEGYSNVPIMHTAFMGIEWNYETIKPTSTKTKTVTYYE